MKQIKAGSLSVISHQGGQKSEDEKMGTEKDLEDVFDPEESTQSAIP